MYKNSINKDKSTRTRYYRSDQIINKRDGTEKQMEVKHGVAYRSHQKNLTLN